MADRRTPLRLHRGPLSGTWHAVVLDADGRTIRRRHDLHPIDASALELAFGPDRHDRLMAALIDVLPEPAQAPAVYDAVLEALTVPAASTRPTPPGSETP